MKQYFAISILLFTLVETVCAAKPEWVENVPRHQSPNFECKVVYSRARTEKEAEDASKEKIYELACKKAGVSLQSNIRFEPVASYYTNDKVGFILLYNLYVIANKAEYYGEADAMTKGIPHSVKLGIIRDIKLPQKQTPPAYWDEYKTMSYISIPKEHHLNNKNQKGIVIDSLWRISEMELLNRKYALDESTLKALMGRDEYFDAKKKEVHTVVYIQNERLISKYTTKISESLTVTIENEIKDAQSFENTGDYEIAIATYKKAQDQCEETASLVAQLKALTGESPLVVYYNGEINKAREVLRTGLAALRKKAAPNREKRLRELLDIAQKAEKERKLGTVLKYYYGALAYMGRFPQAGSLTINYDYAALGRPWGTKITNTSTNHTLKDWLPEHIKLILSSIRVHCYQDDSDVFKKNFVFTWPDNTPVTNGDFCFNLNKGEGWSWLYDITDGEGEIEKRDCPQKFDIQFEYKYIEQWHSDEAIRNEVKNATADFSTEAIHHITVENSKPKSLPPTIPDKPSPSTDARTAYIKSSNSPLQNVLESEKGEYKEAIAKICDAIKTKHYASVKDSFTPKGYKLFLNFVEGGKVTVKNATQYNLISCWDEVYARSIKMTIQYHSKKDIMTKNVVFVFNADKKIHGIQFAIDEVTRQDINAQDNWSNEMKFAVMNFIENYQTAYNLKRLDYIKSVFSDDAVIIVGQVLPVTKVNDSGNINFNDGKSQKVKYYKLSKDEYLKRLTRIFGTNEWIDINFANIDISQHPNQDAKAVYGLGMRQDYSSQHYGDTGYLFLVVDMNDQQKPVIHLRVWTPEAEFGWPQYLQLLKDEQATQK